MRTSVVLFAQFVLCAALAGCAATGARSPQAQPVLYPNAAMNRMGEAQAKTEVNACIDRAIANGLHPESGNNAAGQGAARGAVMGGVAGVVGSLVTGHGIEGALKQGVATAAVGGATGAAGGAMQSQNQPNPLYRNFVQRCVAEKGLEVLGWN
jgi:outer membrane lipoprotein SlyB